MSAMLAHIRKRPRTWLVCVQVLLFAVLQAHVPKERLDFFPWELALLAGALPFLFILPMRTWWRRFLATFIVTQCAIVVIHYNLHGGTLSLVSFFLALGPGFLWGLVSLLRWSYGHVKQAESREALWMSTISWGFFALAYPPLPLGPASLVLLAPWLLVLMRHDKGRVLFATFWSGILFHALSYFWIFNVAKVGPPVAVIGGLFLLLSYFSMFYTFAAWLFVKLRDVGKGKLVWLFPFAWAGIEVLRSYGQISFPWGHLGYVFGSHVELMQGAAWIGVYGYTILILFSNMVLAFALRERRWKLALIPLLLLAGMWLQGSLALRGIDAQQAKQLAVKSESMRIALVQPSISQTKKWSKGYFDSVMAKTWSMMDTVRTDSLDLVVLPETAIPDFIRMRGKEELEFRQFAVVHHVEVLVGALDFDLNGPAPRRYNYYNSAFLFTPNGGMTRFVKTRLVPFAEYLPFAGLLPLVNYVDLGEGDFTAGDTLPLFGSQLWTPNICYESIYPDIMRNMVDNGTRLVVNITNDGWFGKTTAPGQHANLIRVRSIESGMPVARTANSGISIFYDEHGRDYERTGLFENRVVYHRVPLRTIVTFYARHGGELEALWAALLGIVLLVCLLSGRRARRQ